MTPTQSFATKIHRVSRAGRARVMDNDLARLADGWPDLTDVFEEVQYLRNELRGAYRRAEALNQE
jgi:hypothetical protein